MPSSETPCSPSNVDWNPLAVAVSGSATPTTSSSESAITPVASEAKEQDPTEVAGDATRSLDSSDAKRREDTSTQTDADSLAGAVVMLVGLTIVQRLAGLARNVLVCRWLDPTDLGEWNLANSFLILAAPLVTWGIPGSFNRYWSHYQQRGMARSFLSRMLTATACLAGLGVIGMGTLSKPINHWVFGNALDRSLWQAMGATLLILVAFNGLMELTTAMRRVRLVAYFQFANSLAFLAFSLLWVRVIPWGATGVMWAYCAACGLTLAGMIYVLAGAYRALPPDASTESLPTFWRRLLPFAACFWLSDLLNNVFAAVDRFLLLHWSGETEEVALGMLGQYHSSQILGSLLVTFLWMLSSVVLSYVSHEWERGQRDHAVEILDGALKALALSLTVLSAVAIWLAPWVFEVALAGKYRDGLEILPMTMMYSIWFGLLPMAKNFLWCREQARWVGPCLVVGIILAIGLGGLWVPTGKLSGAVAATAWANWATLVLVMCVCRPLGWHWNGTTLLAIACPALLPYHPPLALGLSLAACALSLTIPGFWTAVHRQAAADLWTRRGISWNIRKRPTQ